MNGAFMNVNRIEEILRKAPSPKAPEDLLRTLKAGIRRPQAMPDATTEWNRPSWMRRWLPALSFAAILLVCLVAVGVQTNLLMELQRENGELQAAAQNLGTLRAENAQQLKPAVQSDESAQLQKDNAEVVKLRAEVAQLQGQLREAGNLRAENARIKAQINANLAASGVDPDALAKAREEADRTRCVNNLKQIGLAARIWAADNMDVYPTNFISMTNELSTWKILQCPSDKSHSVTNWAEVAAGNISYIMDAPGGSQTTPLVVFAECPFHHNYCLMDGSVQHFSEAGVQKRIKVVDGVKMMVP